MKKALGIFRGFPGLGRVVAGVALLEILREEYNFFVEAVSYLQGAKYLNLHGFNNFPEAIEKDYSSIGLIPTYKIGAYIHKRINDFRPDIIVIDGEPLIVQSIKISHPEIPVVVLLNPSDVDNPYNDSEAMEYFNALYSLADLAIIHGLRRISHNPNKYKKIISIDTILRKEILEITNTESENIYCLLGGGTVNTDCHFEESTIKIGMFCLEFAKQQPSKKIHIMCSSTNIFNTIKKYPTYSNVFVYKDLISPLKFLPDAGLIVTRSGRNMLSEILYLGIPAITFITGDFYRQTEQMQNIDKLCVENVRVASIQMETQEFCDLCKEMIGKKAKVKNRKCGNEIAINSILELAT